MKKIIYFIPGFIFLSFYLFIGMVDSFSSLQPLAWIITALLILSGILMALNKSWGYLVGIVVGMILIFIGFYNTGQLFKEWPIGIILILYYLACSKLMNNNYKTIKDA